MQIFGGTLMRLAFELAWVTAGTYARQKPIVVATEEMVFMAPVDIGALLHLKAVIVYAEGCAL